MEQTNDAVNGLLERLLEVAPAAIGVLLLLVVGVLLSALARRATRWVVRRTGLEVLAERAGAPRLLYAIGIKQSVPDVLGTVVWVAGLLITANAVSEQLGLSGVSDGIAAVIAFIPRAITGALIGLAGLAAAEFVQGLVARIGAARSDVETADFLGRVGYTLVLAVGLAMAAEHVGLQTQLINAIILLGVAAVLFAVGLSFALGSQSTFRHLVARHYLQRMYRKGDELRFDDEVGKLVRFGAVSAVLRTGDDELVVPCGDLLGDRVHLVRRREDPVSGADPR